MLGRKVAMRLLKFSWPVLAMLVLSLNAASLKAQIRHEHTPFADPLEFDPDWQWFAPVDMQHLEELSPKKRANTGWFASYDQTYIWLSRPDNFTNGQFNSFGAGDFVWGNRTDLGFMRENGSGWSAHYRRMSTGCGVWHTVLAERLNRRIEVDEDTEPIPGDENNAWFGYRVYEVKDSLNVASLNSFEINKTFRRSPYRYGGILEKLIGLRYTNFKDIAQDQNYERSTDSLVSPGEVTDEFQLEILTSDRTVTLNRMIGGQLGLRYFTHYHRWRLSGEFKTFLAANFQTNTNMLAEYSTFYSGGPGEGTDVTATTTTESMIERTDQRTVWGYEVKADAAYQLTKYLSARGGVEVLEFARGIWRGGTRALLNNNDSNQHVFMAGLTFGLELNR